MADVLLTKRSAGNAVYLAASDDHSITILRGLKDGETVRCKINRPRNPRHHRLAWAMIGLIFKNQERFPTEEAMVDAIKYMTGHFDEIELPNGKRFHKLRSLSWEKMDQTQFKQWFDRFVQVTLEHIIPGLNKADFEREIYAMIGEKVPGPIKTPDAWEEALEGLLVGISKCRTATQLDRYTADNEKLLLDMGENAPAAIIEKWNKALDLRSAQLDPAGAG